MRAVAVTAVILYHAFPDFLRSGFLGVDVFFVISGYLITNIITDELNRGTFSLWRFYARRILRIFPALITVSACCLVFGWFLMLPIEFQQLNQHMIGGALFVSNFQFWSETGYFDKAAELKPFLHLWSLSVEEQFYLVWPLLLCWTLGGSLRSLKLAVALGIFSFLAQIILASIDPSAAFYWSIGRFWELMAGAAIVLWRGADSVRFSGWFRFRGWRWFLPLLGLGLICLSFSVGDHAGPVSVWWRLLPTIGTCLVIAFGESNPLGRAALGSRGMVQIGRISYPLYLWHWPLLSFLRISNEGLPSVWSRAIMIFIGLGLAWITYVVIERPIRFNRHRVRSVFGLCACLIALGGIGFVGSVNAGFPSRMPEPLRKYVSQKYDLAADARVRECWLAATDAFNGFHPVCFQDRRPGRKSVLVWGDSHAGRLYVGIFKVYGNLVDVLQLTRDSCAPVIQFGYDNCIKSNDYVMSLIEKNPPDTVVMFAAWSGYMEINAGEAAHKLRETIERLNKIGVREIEVIGPAPLWTTDLPRVLVQSWRRDFSVGRLPVFVKSHLMESPFETDKQLEVLVSSESAEYVSLIKMLCGEEGCMTRADDSPEGLMTADYGHLTAIGAEYVARRLPVTGEGKRAIGH
jgi:peptidoglycan/LPS O-acetylase OafA/YrhL